MPVTPQRSGRFAIIPARAIDDSRLGNVALRVLCALGTYSDRNGRCWPSLVTIARRLGMSRQAVSKQIQALHKLGYLDIEAQQRPDGGKGVNAYRLLFDGKIATAYDRLGDESEDQGGCQPQVDSCQPQVAGHATSEVATIRYERPIRTNIYTGGPKGPARSDQSAKLEEDFQTFWQAYPSRRPHSNPKKPARAKFIAVVKAGTDPADIIRGAEAYAAYVAAQRTDAQYIKQAATWLNQEGWTENHQPPMQEPRRYAGMC